MFSYDLPAPGEHPIYDEARKVMAHTYRRFERPFDDNVPDAIQQAAMTYWYHGHKRGKGPGYAWVAARRDLAHHLWKRNYNPRFTVSLDTVCPDSNGDRPWLEELQTAERDDSLYRWRLTTDDLRMLVLQLYQARNANIERDVAILDLLHRGYSDNAIALELGFTDSSIQTYRKRLRRRLRDYCRRKGIPTCQVSQDLTGLTKENST